MRNSKQIGKDILQALISNTRNKDDATLCQKISEILVEIALTDIKEATAVKETLTDSALIHIFKEQRKKYQEVCEIVNAFKKDLLLVTDFDEAIKILHPLIYKWYISNIVVN